MKVVLYALEFPSIGRLEAMYEIGDGKSWPGVFAMQLASITYVQQHITSTSPFQDTTRQP